MNDQTQIDQSEEYYQWLFENTVDFDAPDFLLQMVRIYNLRFPGAARLALVKQAIYDTLSYDIESVSDEVLTASLDAFLDGWVYAMAMRHGWVSTINRELEERDDARRCPQCGQLIEVCEENDYWMPATRYEPGEWVCGKEREEIEY